jgi:trimethylamine--corrinoid protein Co-methyltransferase
MARENRRSGRRRNTEAAALKAPAIQQLPRRKLRSPFAPLQPLSEDQLEHIHNASLRILEELGIEVMGQQAISLFKQAGADVQTIDANAAMVRLDRNLVMELVAMAPGPFDLVPRNVDNTVTLGGNHINFGMVSGTPNVHDAINGRRIGNMADFDKLIKFGQYFNVISMFGNQATAPTDLPANTRHMDTTQSSLVLSDKPFYATGIGAGRVRDTINLTAIAMGKSLEELSSQVHCITNINVNSPRKLDDAMAYGAMQMALMGQATTVTPFTLMGAMTPATMAGALAQQNAEALLGVCLIQLTKPGAPVIYGGFTSNVDMKTGSPAFGTPENALANIAGGQLARRYNLPYRTSACNASNAVDAQATYETQNALWGAVMGHGNIIYHAAGWLEGGLVASFEKVVVDCEMLQHMSEMLQPIQFTDADIGIDAMEEVGAGGHFFGCDHTMQRYQTAFYSPFLSDWQNSENWQKNGAKTATERATHLWQKILDDFEAPALDQSRIEAMAEYKAKRIEALGANEPEMEPELMC